MYPHRIRLRGPWEAEPLDPPGETRRVTMPASLAECGLGDYRRVRFRRRFGRPRQIDAHERVWLVGEGIVGRGSVKLNGFNIGEIGPGTFEFLVPEELAERNELTIELTADSPDDGLRGDVALEIRCSAYLRAVRSCAGDGGRLRIGGDVAGES
ncbi:MAG TPA: hypothetical protein VH120_19085, partial [Gemmataceae bacterium]|nr:hypothetical protein [Gemmataceae bacterium]